MRRFILLFALLGLILSCATTGTAKTDTPKADTTPEPYGPEEFSPGLVKLRRGEILFFGSLPLFYMFSSLGYDLLVTDPPSDTNELLGQKMGITLSLSGVLALADFIVGEIQNGKNTSGKDDL